MTPITGPGTQRIQPIWLDDVAAYFVSAVDSLRRRDRMFELGGPDAVSWNEFWERLKERSACAGRACTCRWASCA